MKPQAIACDANFSLDIMLKLAYHANMPEETKQKPDKTPFYAFVGTSLVISFLLFSYATNKNSQEDRQKPSISPTQIQQKTPEQLVEEKEREEARITELATQYCAERTKSSRYYPIPEAIGERNGKTEYELNDDLKKQGSNLTQTDCKAIINYLMYMSDKYAGALSINFKQVIEREYWIGMNVAELFSSLGYPNKINETNYGSGSIDQYVYYKDSYGASAYYLYIQNSKVTSYQNF